MISETKANLDPPKAQEDADLTHVRAGFQDRLTQVMKYARELRQAAQSLPSDAPPALTIRTVPDRTDISQLRGDARVERFEGRLRVVPLQVERREEDGCVYKVIRYPAATNKRRRVSQSSTSESGSYCGMRSQDLDDLVNSVIDRNS